MQSPQSDSNAIEAPNLIPVTRKTLRRRSHSGSNLMLLCAVGTMIVGFMGISIYSGLQTFMESDLQRLSMNAALVGASRYYKSDAATAPAPDSGGAITAATQTFNTLVANSSLKGFNPSLVSVTNNDSTDSVTVTSKASMDTGFLAPIGIKKFEVNATSTARALKYQPTNFTGPVKITPDGTTVDTYSQTLTLAFPLTDGPGNDLYVEQDSANQQGYVIEACNDTDCYDVTSAASPVGTSQLLTVNGVQVLYGTAMIDIGKAGVRKASKLRFTHANNFDSYNLGVLNPAPTAPNPLVIRKVMLFGYAGTCVSPTSCGVPAGFDVVF
jgi:hypothetical protein